MTTLNFSVWAPDEQTFKQSWIDAGILQDEEGYQFTEQYPGIQLTTTWSGIIIKTPAILDEQQNEIQPATIIPGWHCNVRVSGPLVEQMTYQLDQYDQEGNLLSIFDRTWAVNIFQLTEVNIDPETNFPVGYSNSTGVRYCDPKDFKSPSNVWM